MISLKKPHRLTTRFSFKPAALVSSSRQKALQSNRQICICGLHTTAGNKPQVWLKLRYSWTTFVNLQTRIKSNLSFKCELEQRETGYIIINNCIILSLCLLFPLQIEVKISLAVSNFLSES